MVSSQGGLSDGLSETQRGLDPGDWGCPVKRNLRALTLRASVTRLWGVKDGLSETRRGLVPEGEDSDGRKGEDT